MWLAYECIKVAALHTCTFYLTDMLYCSKQVAIEFILSHELSPKSLGCLRRPGPRGRAITKLQYLNITGMKTCTSAYAIFFQYKAKQHMGISCYTPYTYRYSVLHWLLLFMFTLRHSLPVSDLHCLCVMQLSLHLSTCPHCNMFLWL